MTGQKLCPILHSSVPLSFWGGVDPLTGVIVDQSHPLFGKCITDTALCLPGGRGSSTGSQTMLELILNGTAPAIIILQRPDVILCTGAIIAQEFFQPESQTEKTVCTHKKTLTIPRFLCVLEDVKQGKLHHEMDPLDGIITNNLDYGSIFDLLGKKNMKDDTYYYSHISLLDHDHFRQGPHISNSDKTGNNTSNLLLEAFISSSSPSSSSSSSSMIFRVEDLLDQSSVLETSTMNLTSEEIGLLQSAYANDRSREDPSITPTSSPSLAQAMAMKTIYRIAKLTNAPNLLPITRVHVDACTFIGLGGLQFVESLVRLGGKVVVPTTTNASSVDRQRWKSLGTPSSPSVAQAACAVQDAYVQLGCLPTFTCAPYLSYNQAAFTSLTLASSTPPPPPPTYGEQIAWGESNAVVYANSILGARTEKYADYLDICAALVGKVPNIGVHRDENRLPTLVIDTSQVLKQYIVPYLNRSLPMTAALNADHAKFYYGIDAIFPILGWLCGILTRDHIPLILGMDLLLNHDTKNIMMDHIGSTRKAETNDILSLDDLKAFSAAFGTTATAPMFHMAGVTPEAKDRSDIETMIKHVSQVSRENQNQPELNHSGTIHTRRIEITFDQVLDAFKSLNGWKSGDLNKDPSSVEKETTLERQTRTDMIDQIDLVALGNPNFSLSELATFTNLMRTFSKNPVEEKEKRNRPNVSITMSRDVYTKGKHLGYTSFLEQEFGVQFISDTCWCMLLDPPVIPARPDGQILTNSGKYAHYGPGLTNRRLRFGSLFACAQASRTGKYNILDWPKWMENHSTIRWFGGRACTNNHLEYRRRFSISSHCNLSFSSPNRFMTSTSRINVSRLKIIICKAF